MSGDTVSVRAADWREAATPVTDPACGLTVSTVADRTGLRPDAILYAMNRRRERAASDPMRHLTRPRWSLGAEPRWDEDAVQAYCAARDRRDRDFASRYGKLKSITTAEAEERGLVSLRRVADAVGVHLTTMHRWTHEEGFPAPVAVIGTAGGPTPRVVRRWESMRNWLRANRDHLTVPDTLPPLAAKSKP